MMKPCFAPLGIALAAVILASPLIAQPVQYWGGGSANVADNTDVPTTSDGMEGDWFGYQNWADSPTAPNIYDSWKQGGFANLGLLRLPAVSNTNLSIGSDLELSGLFFAIQYASDNRVLNLTDTTTRTLTLVGPSATFFVPTTGGSKTVGLRLDNIAFGASDTRLVLDGGNAQVTLNNSNSNSFTGNVLIRDSGLMVAGNSTMAGVSQWDILGYRTTVATNNMSGNQAFSAPVLRLTGTNASNDQIKDDAVITLRRGQLDLRGGGANHSETIGKVVLAPHGEISVGNNTTAGGRLVLSDSTAGIDRGPSGYGTLHVIVPNDDSPRRAIEVHHGIATDVLLPWISTNRAEFLMADSANNNALTRVVSTSANTDLSTWATSYNAASNLRFDGTTAVSNSLTDDTTISTLGFRPGGTAFAVNLSTHTLNISAGGVALQGSGNVAYTISGGKLTTDADVFYISTGSANTSRLVLDTEVTGAFDIVKSGLSELRLGPDATAASTPNTFVGNLHINMGTVNLTKDAALAGDVFVRSGGGLSVGRALALSPTSSISMEPESLFTIAANNLTIGGSFSNQGGHVLMTNQTNVAFAGTGTGFVFDGGTFTHNSSAAGSINILTDLRYTAGSEGRAVFQRLNPAGAFTINLNTGANQGDAERVFQIARNEALAPGVPEMLVDTVIADGGSGNTTGSLRKTGTGTLMLTGANTYTGGTTVDGGVLHLGTMEAAAQSGLRATFANSGGAGETLTFLEPITSTMAVGQDVSGTGIASGRRIAGIANEYQVHLTGTGGTNNAFATDIALSSVSRSGSLAGNVLVNDGGTLQLDPGSAVNGEVTVGFGGTLRGSGLIAGTALIGGMLSPGSSPGTMTFGGDLALSSSATLELEIGGLDAGEYDLIASSGSGLLNLNGTLVLSLIGGYTPTTGDQITVFQGWSTISGSFETVSGLDLGHGLTWDLSQLNSSGMLMVVPEPGFWALLLGGAALLAVLVWRRRR